jgi:MauM/NapG family ferredoxin protein
MKRPSVARLSQLLFLAIFLVLFVQTEYRGKDELGAAVNAFFRANPLTLVSTLLADRSFSWLLFPAVVTLIATVLLGRFVCGWLCPLGTLLDLIGPRFRRRGAIHWLTGSARYWLLLPLLAAAALGSNLAGLLDPIALLLRGLSLALYPLFGTAVRESWVGLFHLLGDTRDIFAPAYGLLRDYLLPFRTTIYPLAFLSLGLLVGIFALEASESRAWCRRLCPLGTLLGLAGRFSLFRRIPPKVCSDCTACRELCPSAFDQEILQEDACIRCMSCVSGCQKGRARFSWSPSSREQKFLPSRRVLLGGIVSGFALARLFRFRSPEAQARLLRPPGVREEKEFLSKCVRCGECLKVCLKAALYPAAFQAGAEGLYTPILLPRLGYCEYNCTLCGQVCPTGAIPDLPVPDKQRAVIGKAVFDKNHCLPFAKQVPCIVCEEHCPIPGKAILFEMVAETLPDGRRITLQNPRVVDERCNGCGICEFVCPLDGPPGVLVVAVKDKAPLVPPTLGSSSIPPY